MHKGGLEKFAACFALFKLIDGNEVILATVNFAWARSRSIWPRSWLRPGVRSRVAVVTPHMGM